MSTTAYPNWFEMTARPYFERHLLPLAGKPDLLFLQIGAFTGDASVWLLDNVLTGEGSHLTDVDTWEGSEEPEHGVFSWPDVLTTYNAHTFDARRSGRLDAVQSTSARFWLRDEHVGPYDFIYIDGDHTAAGVLCDAVHAYDRLHAGGLISFDDYRWRAHSGRDTDRPGLAIDAFATCYADRLEPVDIGGEQAWFRRTA